jgi:hypothetical protein
LDAGWVPEVSGGQQRVCPSKYALNPDGIMSEPCLPSPLEQAMVAKFTEPARDVMICNGMGMER